MVAVIRPRFIAGTAWELKDGRNMKLKYYLRGLGIGMLVTAMILGIAGGSGQRMSDAQIRARAYELGMVEGSSKVLSDLQTGEPADRGQPEVSGEDSGDNASGTGGAHGQATPSASGESEQSLESDPSGGSEASGDSKPREDDNPTSGEGAAQGDGGQSAGGDGQEASQTDSVPPESDGAALEGEVCITIQKGAGSESVSRLLEEAGLVEDAGEFNRYLCDNGYSKRLQAGTYYILPGTAREEIVEIITGR